MSKQKTAVTGGDFVLYFEKETDPNLGGAPIWEQIAGQRNASLSQSSSAHEVSVKGAGGWKDYIPGFREWSISCDGLYMLNDESYKLFSQAYVEQRKLKIKISLPGELKYEGMVLIENFDLSMGYDEAVTYSCTLLGCGALELLEETE